MNVVSSFYALWTRFATSGRHSVSLVHLKSRFTFRLYSLCGRYGRGGRGIKLSLMALREVYRGVIEGSKGSTIGKRVSIASTFSVTLYQVSQLRQNASRPPASRSVHGWNAPRFDRELCPEVAGLSLAARLWKFAFTVAGYPGSSRDVPAAEPGIDRVSYSKRCSRYALAGPGDGGGSLFPRTPNSPKNAREASTLSHWTAYHLQPPLPEPGFNADSEVEGQGERQGNPATSESSPESPSKGVPRSAVAGTWEATSRTKATLCRCVVQF